MILERIKALYNSLNHSLIDYYGGGGIEVSFLSNYENHENEIIFWSMKM